jgi:putative restriction endonuclease
MNPHNGICLCSLHDRAFDKGLLIVDLKYQIRVHPDVEALRHVPAVSANFIQFIGESLNLPDRWHPDPTLLERHQRICDETRTHAPAPTPILDRGGVHNNIGL